MVISSLLCLFAPFPLWLLETLLPLPHLIEEIFKFFVVKSTPSKNNWLYPLILGLIFSLSETALYIINFFALGSFADLPLRLLTTSVLHISLFYLQYAFRRQKYLNLVALSFGIYLHFLYNQLVFSLGH